jgi:hypothetical protein
VHRPTLSLAATIAAVALAAGCGGRGDSGKQSAVQEGAIVYRDALSDNRGDWLVDRRHGFVFAGGRYQWGSLPKLPASATVGPGAMAAMHIPAGISVSAGVKVDEGAALRVLTCRETGPRDKVAQRWYEAGIDGRQAMIRRMSVTGPPNVLARAAEPVPNGRRVQMTAQCVPDRSGAVVLVLRLDGREVARAVDSQPLPAVENGLEGTTGIRAYRRPDTLGAVSLAWDHFVVRRATLGSS